MSPNDGPLSSPARDEAAAWVIRQERGLTAEEQDRLSQWLAADPRHGAALARHRAHWDRLEPLTQWRPEHSAEPNPDLLEPPRRRPAWFYPAAALAAGLAVLLAWGTWRPPATRLAAAGAGVTVREASATRQALPDGSVVELNHGAELRTNFTTAERRVELARGEAHFSVVRDPARPFVVAVGRREVRAVGTAFNVRLGSDEVEVLVTEGRVQIGENRGRDGRGAAAGPPAAPTPLPGPLLEAGQRAVVGLEAGPEARIATLTQVEIERVLAWQHRRLEFTAAPLEAVVAEFNRTNRLQLVIAEPSLAPVRLSASFRSDNVEGFVRLLEVGFAIRGERRGDREILLRRAPP